MNKNRLFNCLFVAILAVGPILGACSGRPGQGGAAGALEPTGTAVAEPDNQAPSATSISTTPTVTAVPSPPAVVSVQPAKGEEQPLDAPVVITFDQAMDPLSISEAFKIEPPTEGRVEARGNTLTFKPTQPLQRGMDYRVTVAADASSQEGVKLQAPISFGFTTAGFLDVTNTQPAHGAEGIPVTTTITLAFNRPVVPLTSIADQANLPHPLMISPAAAGQGQWLNTSIYQWAPAGGLAASTQYTITVPSGLQDASGGLLAADYSFGFRTADPTVLTWLPESAASLAVESPITVTFSMPMDRRTTEAAWSFTDEQGTPVDGRFGWSADGTVLGFKPLKTLQFGQRYRAEVASTARPANGAGSLRDASTWVRTYQSVSLPKVVSTSPAAGLKRADPTGGVSFQFASPMDAATFVTGTVTVLPAPAQLTTNYSQWDNVLYVQFDKLPATAYTVTLSGKVADPYGNLLGRDFVLNFTTRDFDPLLQVNGTGFVGTYNAYTETEAVVTYRNVPQISFSLYRTPAEDFLRLTTGDYWQAWDSYRPTKGNLIRTWSVETDARPNRLAILRAKLTDEGDAQLPPGLYFLQIPEAMAGGDRYATRELFARVDLNLTLKAAQDEALAWVTDLKSGQPVPGATVRFTDGAQLDLSATTDDKGVAKAAFPSSRRTWDPLLAFASADGGGFGVVSSGWADGIGPWDFGLPGGASSEPYAAYVYTDRPIYRPGQTMYWKALIRRDDDAHYSIPTPGQPVTVTISDDRGNQLLVRSLPLGPQGTLNGELPLGPDATLGYYYVSVQPSKDTSYGVGFQVAEYRKPEYELAASTDRPEYTQGEQIKVAADASYFFGGPVRNAKVNWVLLSNDAYFDYKGKGYFSFTDWDWYETPAPPFGGVISQGQGKTDASGEYTFAVPADVTRYTQSQRFTFDITITDATNQAVSTQATALVHKGAFYIGLSPRSYVAIVGKPSQVDVITVDPQSKTVADTDVRLVVNRIEWYSVREQAENGLFYWATRAKKTAVFTETLTTDYEGKALLSWTPQTGGEYKVEAESRDSGGHLIRSAAFVWVGTSASQYVSWRQENNDRIELIPDRKEYSVGDTAELLVASPFQGKVKALLTIERNHVLSYEVLDLNGNSEVLRIPIKAEHAPNIYVSVVLAKGMDASSPAPGFRVGLAQLKVSVADKELQIVLTPRKSSGEPGLAQTANPPHFGPREKVVWGVQVLDHDGKPVQAEVSLALVDKAVLSLADDNAGKLLDRFYSQRALGVQTGGTWVVNVDRLVALVPEGGKGGGGGGGMGAGEFTVRREFPDNAYWNAVVSTDAGGKAEVEVSLPDNLTTWTMDARAITADTLVGQVKSDIIATKDLLVRPVLPRFFTQEDEAQIAAVVHNTTESPIEVRISLEAQGLQTQGQTESIVTIPAGDTHKAVWPVSVEPSANEVKVLMRAESVGASSSQGTGAGLQDAVEITLPVYGYTTPEVTGTSGQVGMDERRLELVRVPSDADRSRGELEIRLEPSLAVGMQGGLTYLEHYPYECIEQTMSRFLPNVVSYQALKSLGIDNPDLETLLPQQVGVGLQRIYAKQHIDGGWGWWQQDVSSLAISSYVVFGLSKAKQAGFTVDQDVLDRGVRFIEQSLKAPADLSGWQLNQQAFAVYALAETGTLEPGRAGALFEQREKLSDYAKAYLAMAFGLINDDASAARIKTLMADVSGRVVSSATAAHWEEDWTDYWGMNTDTRSTSIILDAIAKLDPKNSLGPNTVRWLMSARQGDHWETTQENSWAIIALTDWMVVTGELKGDYDWAVSLNGGALGKGAVSPQTIQDVITLRADVSTLLENSTNGIVIERSKSAGQTGDGQLYYTMRLKSYLPAEKVQPLSRGLTVNREYRLADCGAREPKACPTIASAKVGDIINVTLSIVVPHALHYVVIEDPLPAGTEAIDTSLRTTSVTAQGPAIQTTPEAENGGWGWWWTPTHTDLRDEKAALFATDLGPGSYEFTYQIRASIPGQFMTLPPTGYEMYFPEVWGRGAGGVFRVTE